MTYDERKAIGLGRKRDRRVREAVEMLDAGVERVLDGEGFKRYLAFAARFHDYSANNCLLVLAQRPGAARIAGYKRWRELGQQVRRGEEGIRILAPIFRTVEDEGSGERRRVLSSFKVVKVFDASQTDPIPGAGPLPEKPGPEVLTGSSEAARGLARSLARICEAEGLTVREDSEELDALYPGANGLYSPRKGLILLREGASDDGRAKTLAHELAHHLLLHRDAPASGAERAVLEAEAEGTAYAVLSYFGVDASGYSFAYVAHWAERKEMVKAVLARVQMAARRIIGAAEDGRSCEGTAGGQGAARPDQPGLPRTRAVYS
jgi:antirestriction protein ArdC